MSYWNKWKRSNPNNTWNKVTSCLQFFATAAGTFAMADSSNNWHWKTHAPKDGNCFIDWWLNFDAPSLPHHSVSRSWEAVFGSWEAVTGCKKRRKASKPTTSSVPIREKNESASRDSGQTQSVSHFFFIFQKTRLLLQWYWWWQKTRQNPKIFQSSCRSIIPSDNTKEKQTEKSSPNWKSAVWTHTTENLTWLGMQGALNNHPSIVHMTWYCHILLTPLEQNREPTYQSFIPIPT